MRKIIVAIVLMLYGQAHACMAKLMPDENWEKYSEIFIGEVSGVHLIGYEKDRLKSLSRGDNQRWFTDVTQTQNLNLLVTKVFVGKPKPLLDVKVGGCGVVTPHPMMFGIFFVSKETGAIIPIYETEGELYYELLVKLGKMSR